MLKRIQIDTQICNGRATIRGLRITVDFVLKLMGDGYDADDIIRLYPELEKEDVYEAAKYGAGLQANAPRHSREIIGGCAHLAGHPLF